MGFGEAALYWLPTVAVVVFAVVAAAMARGRHLVLVIAAGLVASGVAGWRQLATFNERQNEAAQLRDLSDRLETIARVSTSGTEIGPSHAQAGAVAAVTALKQRVKALEDQIASLREHYQSRTIDDPTAKQAADYLRTLGTARVVVSCAPGDAEAYNYASRLVELLRAAGWDAQGPEPTQIFGNKPAMPVTVFVPDGRPGDAARALVDAFTRFHIPVQSGVAPSEGIPDGPQAELYVPKKP